MFKRIISKLHLYLGLTAGIVIFIVCLTGALYTFRTQIENAINYNKVFVKAQEQERLPLNVIADKLEQQGLEMTSLTYYDAKNRSLEIHYKAIEVGNSGFFYVNPYTGESLGGRNTVLSGFFNVVLSLHKNLLLSNIGRTLVGYSILIFVFMLLSGFVLWLPQRWKAIKRALWIKRREGTSRFILDLHNVLGFYSIPILLLISVMGLYVAFPWVKSALIVSMGGSPVISQGASDDNTEVNDELSASFAASLAKIMEQKEDEAKELNQHVLSLDSIVLVCNELLPYSAITTINLPDSENNWIKVSKINQENFLRALLPDVVELNKKGELKHLELFKDKSLSEQFIALSLPLHTGEILGWPSLILYFIACLIATSLPVTGTLLWYRRQKAQTKFKLPRQGKANSKGQAGTIQKNWLIVYATKSGNSKLVAQKAQHYLQNHHIQVRCENMAQMDLSQLSELSKLMVVMSTDGEGVPPSSANAFFNYLDKEASQLGHLEYAICALGDSSYEHFCEAGKLLESKLTQLEAKAFIPSVHCDADFGEYASEWIKTVTQALLPKHSENSHLADMHMDIAQEYRARVHRVERLSKTSDKPCYHLVIKSDEPINEIKPGNSIEIKPENPDWIVQDLYMKLGDELQPDLYPYLKKEVELTSLSRKTASQYQLLTADKKLKAMMDDKIKAKEYFSKANFIDLLNDFPAELETYQIKQVLPRIKSRFYSVASCTDAHPNEIHLTVKAIRFLFNNSQHEGAGSIQITEKLKEGSALSFKHYSNLEFRLPESIKPIIMIGVGTGIAPFMAFLQNYKHRNIKNKCWLIWGDKNSQSDYLYEKELAAYKLDNTLKNLDVVFSRDGNKRLHVQDILPNYKGEISNWLQQDAHIYVCGSMDMATEVKSTLSAMLSSNATSMGKLIKEQRYHEDAY